MGKHVKPTEFGQCVLDFLDNAAMSKKTFSEEVGISKGYLDRLLRGNAKVARRIVNAMASVMELGEIEKLSFINLSKENEPEIDIYEYRIGERVYITSSNYSSMSLIRCTVADRVILGNVPHYILNNNDIGDRFAMRASQVLGLKAVVIKASSWAQND